MLWRRRRSREIARTLSREARPLPYWRVIWRRLQQQRMARWSLRVVYLLVFVALFADFLANEKPLYCQIEGETLFPVIKGYAVNMGLSRWSSERIRDGWRELEYERVVWAPVPYSHHTIDRRNMGYRSPLEDQQVRSIWFRHWLGTDQTGRDVLAGMIRGTRIAILVGVIAMSIAGAIGIVLGALAGYFGDGNLRVSWLKLLAYFCALLVGGFIGFIGRAPQLREGPFAIELLKSLGILAAAFLLARIAARILLLGFPAMGGKITFPVDSLVMRTIEVFNSIPGLLLVLAIVALLDKPSVYYVMVIIGLISWTTVARFVRAELMRIRKLEYIEGARALGYPKRRIIFRHALPNALTPVFITIAFGMAGAVLLEAFLSFLGIGLAATEVSWGYLLNLSRTNVRAWWLAIFPGLAIFLTVTSFNLIGEGLSRALEGEVHPG